MGHGWAMRHAPCAMRHAPCAMGQGHGPWDDIACVAAQIANRESLAISARKNCIRMAQSHEQHRGGGLSPPPTH
eukprot:2622521-Lingulodinium_polyedra.AAC.1